MLIAPFFIDWTAWRADFEREASRILGQSVVVKGEASARLLPFPSVSFGDVEVAGGPNGAPLLTVWRFEMDAELAPWLSGEIRIFSMRVEDPVLTLAVDADGRMPAPPRGGALPVNASVVLEEVAIANGTVRVEDAAAGRTRTLTNIEGRFAAQSLAGPVTGDGTLRAEGRPLSFQIASATPLPAGDLPLRLTVDDPALLVSTTVDGALALADGAPRFEGALRAARVEPPSAPEAEARPVVSPLPPFTLAGRFAGTAKGVEASELRLAVGGEPKPYVLTGKAAIAGGAEPRFTLDLQGEQVDIDGLAAGKGPRRDTGLAARLDTARGLLAAIPRPELPGTVRLSLPVLVAGDTTIRDLAVEASPEGADDWLVRRLQAELPGRTRLEASGTLEAAAALRFRGSLLVAARQPSGFSEWLTGAVDPAVRLLPGAGFSAVVDLAAGHQRLDGLEVDIGGDRLTGNLERSGKAGNKTIAVDLAGGRMDLDALVAFSRLFTGRADSIAEARRGTLKLAAGPVVYEGATIDRVDADLGYDGEALDIRRADLKGLAASDIAAKGRLTGLGGDPAGRIEFTLDSTAPGELAGFLSQKLPNGLALDALQSQAPTLAPLRLAGTLGTVPGGANERPTLNVSVKGTAARTDVSLSMMLGNGIYAGGAAGGFGGELSLTSADPPELLGQLGVAALPIPVPAPLALTLSVSAGATGPVAASAALRAPGSELTTEGTLALSASGFDSGEFRTALRSDDLAPWLIGTGTGFGASPLDALPVVAGASTRFDARGIKLADIAASVGGVDLTGDLEKAWSGPAGGSLFFSELSVPWLASLFYGQPAADGSGWNAANFGRPVLPDARFGVDLTADSLFLGDGASVGDASVRIEAAPGELKLSDIRGTFAGGYGTGSLLFRNAGGVGGFSATADLQGLDLGAMAISGLSGPSEDEAEPDPATSPPPVFGTMDAAFRLEGSGQSYAGLIAALTGAGTLRFENAGFAGIKPGLFADALSAADGGRLPATQDAVARFVAEVSRGASYPVPQASAAFTVAGGVARFPPVQLRGAGETLAAEGSLALADTALGGRLRLDLDPGEEAVAGAAPAVDYALSGTIGAPKLEANVQPLANYLSVRALEREQARVEALQGALQEKLRLRREARFYRWQDARAAAATAAAATAERLRIERLQRGTRERIERERQEAERAAEAERRRRAAIAEREQRAQAAARAQPQPPSPFDGRALDPGAFSGPQNPQPSPGASAPSLPGVRDPFGSSAGGVQPF